MAGDGSATATGSEAISSATTIEIDASLAGIRLDRAVSQALPAISRSRIQTLFRRGVVQRNGQPCAMRDVAEVGDVVTLEIPVERVVLDVAEALPVDVIYEDEALIIINKPPGRVVHPGAGNRSGTLLNALLHRFPELENVPRAGIVHRLDKDTSGVMMIARTPETHLQLVDLLKEREVHRHYQALVRGRLTGGGLVDEPVGRHPTQRTRMAVHRSGRSAVTHYRVAERFPSHTLLDVSLETGRTHQIRVHMAHVRHPVVGDPVYGGRAREVAGATDELRAALAGFRRQGLHAARLEFQHPGSGESVQFEAPMPEDMAGLLEVMRHDAAARGEK